MYKRQFPGDASDRESVKKLVEYAKSKGNVKTVIHAAGVSPHMADAEKIFTINAVGTINIDEEFAEVMNEGSCILNVSSMSAYMLPEANVPKEVYKLSLKDVDAFKAAANQMLQAVPQEQATGMAYTCLLYTSPLYCIIYLFYAFFMFFSSFL